MDTVSYGDFAELEVRVGKIALGWWTIELTNLD